MRSIRLIPVVLALAAGCARATPAVTGALDPDAAPTHVVLSVDNHNWSDIVVSVEHDSKRDRLGTVKAASKQQLRIPVMWIGASRAIRLVAHRIGSMGEFRSEGFSVQLDQVISWTLESDLQRSSVSLQ
jgi:type IV pilus biogenesis protein CpaD/CtpE